MRNDQVQLGPEVAPVWSYRPRLDGLRAVAVLLVLFYHSDIDGFGFGFLGVDVFFVLSGYLVTRLVLSQHQQGSFRLRTFYSRRVRRLLPAALVLLVVVAWLLVLFETPLRRVDLVGDLRAAALYFANWHFIAEANDYFGSDIDQSPVVHFWSLAIEEQFYFAYPLVLLGVLALARRLPARVATVPLVLGSLALFSVVLQIVVARDDQLRAYYGTDTRLYQLLAGATLAALAHRRVSLVRTRPVPGEVVAIAGGVGLVALATDLGVSISTAGILATLASLALVWGLEVAGVSSAIGTALQSAPAVGIGKLSYGIYLWHWPLIVFTRSAVSEDPRLLLTVGGLGGLAAAMASLRLVEQPVRLSRNPRITPIRAVVVGLGSSLLVGAFLVPAVLRSDAAPAEAAGEEQDAGEAVVDESAVGPEPAELSQPVPPIDYETIQDSPPQQPGCFDRPVVDCTLYDAGADSLHLHLLGDSVAQKFAGMMTVLAEEQEFTLTLTTALGCPWQLDVSATAQFNDECVAAKTDAYERVIPELEPDVVIAISAPRDDPTRPAETRSISGDLDDTDQAAFLAAATVEAVDLLLPHTGRVVIVEPLPVPPDEPLDCLQREATPAPCGFVDHQAPLASEVSSRFAAVSSPAVVSLDLDRLLCPRYPVCDAIVGGIPPYTDQVHPAHDYLLSVREEFLGVLAFAGATSA